MSYQVYSNLSTPDAILVKIAEYVASKGYTVIENAVDDLDIYDMSSSDGKKLVFKSRDASYFYILRSANGTNIFGTTDESAMASTKPVTSNTANGIGVIVSEGYSKTVRWYNQGGIPVNCKGKIAQGLFAPVAVKNESGASLGYTYSLYCNNVTKDSADTLVFSIVKENDSYRQCSHIVIGSVDKYSTWTGGAFFSASATASMISSSWSCFEHKKDADKVILPVLSSGLSTNTLLRIDVDGAPSDDRGKITWLSSGTDNITGKKLSLPVRVGLDTNGITPNFWSLQSHDRLDWGRNVNTLNCLSVNFPMYLAVCRDPDSLLVYATVGQIYGVYFVSSLNMQTGFVYALNYPSSGSNCQVFSMGKRRGVYGYDAISVKQE